jgi:inorganic pyrophosphatase
MNSIPRAAPAEEDEKKQDPNAKPVEHVAKKPPARPSSQLAAHPWHGVSPGKHAPQLVNCYIEIVPTDAVKYELDKETGILKVDRPQLFSNVIPSLYGFIPRTWCGDLLARRCEEKTGKTGLVGDGDPLDICVLTEKTITHSGILVEAMPIGGLRMIDRGEADDKIIAVMKGDAVYGGVKDISELPQLLRDRMRHYFLTYKQLPDDKGTPRLIEIAEVYGLAEAYEVINRTREDYDAAFT